MVYYYNSPSRLRPPSAQPHEAVRLSRLCYRLAPGTPQEHPGGRLLQTAELQAGPMTPSLSSVFSLIRHQHPAATPLPPASNLSPKQGNWDTSLAFHLCSSVRLFPQPPKLKKTTGFSSVAPNFIFCLPAPAKPSWWTAVPLHIPENSTGTDSPSWLIETRIWRSRFARRLSRCPIQCVNGKN